MLIFAKGGHNDESHNHNDIGNFIVYRNGKPVLIDVGVGTYTKQTFSADRYKLWFMQSGYHNLPSFGGVDQKNGATYTSENCVWDPDGKSARVGITKAYPAEAGIAEYYREYKLEGPRATVTENIALTEEKEVTFHIMTHVKPEKLDGSRIALAEGMVLGYDPVLEATVEEVEPVGFNSVGSWGTEVLWRICFTATLKDARLSFVIDSEN
jgi:hypothetical protein